MEFGKESARNIQGKMEKDDLHWKRLESTNEEGSVICVLKTSKYF